MPASDLFTDRRHRAARLLRNAGLDLLLVGPSPSFRYFTGCHSVASERFAAFLLDSSEQASLFVPRLQAPLYENAGLEIRTWNEEEAPLARLAGEFSARDIHRVAVNDEFWAGFLVGLTAAAPRWEFVSDGAVTARLRMCKEPDEIAGLRAAARRIDAVWARVCAAPEGIAGETELTLRSRIETFMRDEGFTEIPWIDVGAGANGASPLHHGSTHVIVRGEPVVCDFAGLHNGWFADICRVAVAGPPDPEYLRVYETVRAAQEAAFRAVRPGVPAEEIDRVGRALINGRGYGAFFTHRIGHGIGLAPHEEPYIVEGNTTALRPGMVFSNEPGIYVPGRWGARIEDIIAVTEDGAERLNTASRDLASLN